MTGTERPLITQGEAARILRVDPRTVRTWTNDGKLSIARLPGSKRGWYLRAEVVALATDWRKS